ncbi:hypothetical protein RB601_002207 [Gaeumannomyces tritici]
MASQVPAGAEGTVAGVMIYCCIAFIASSLMIWLTWIHHERTSYVALLAYFVTLSIVASLVQQTHDVLLYESVVREQFENRKRHPGNPEIAIANGSVGISLVLYYIQYYCYNVEAMCVMFWAAHLAQTAAARRKWSKLLRRIDSGGKIFTVLFPLTTILLLRIPQVQASFVVFILLADLPLMLSLLFGCALMLVIFARYVRSKRKFLHWAPDNSYPAGGGGGSSTLESGIGTTTTQTRDGQPPRKQGIWDRWLMVRFTIAFAALGIFQVTNTLFQIMAVTNATADLGAQEPDLSAGRAAGAWIFFMPGVTPGLFIFIIFGTTAPLRTYMWETLVPARWRGDGAEAEAEAEAETETEAETEAAAAERAAAGAKGRAAAAGPGGDEAEPPPPPKDIGRHGVASETEVQVYGRTGRPKLAEGGRSDSDEWPMLPIMKNVDR